LRGNRARGLAPPFLDAHLQPVLLGERADEGRCLEHAACHQDLAEPAPARCLNGERLLELTLVGEAAFDEELAEPAPRKVGHRHDPYKVGTEALGL
jgi:hypothetical protein